MLGILNYLNEISDTESLFIDMYVYTYNARSTEKQHVHSHGTASFGGGQEKLESGMNCKKKKKSVRK